MKQISSIASRIREYREREDLTLAEMAQRTGVPAQTLNRYELGKRAPKIDVAVQIAERLGVNPLWLQGYDVPVLTGVPDGFDPVPDTYTVPRVGAIACGTPILAEQNIETYDAVPNRIRCDFTLVCKGDSMVGAGIEDGDVVYIRQQPEVENNEIAAVMIDGEATLKYFKRVGDMILLSPANREYEPIIVSGEDLGKVKIVGKAVGFTRFLEK
jgi:repressor LexA